MVAARRGLVSFASRSKRAGRSLGSLAVAVAVAVAVAATSACGAAVELDPGGGRPAPLDGPLGSVPVERHGSRTTLGRALHPELRTVVLLVDGPCASCVELVQQAMAEVPRSRFSILWIDADDPSANAVDPRISRWRGGAEVGRAIELMTGDASSPALIGVVAPDGEVRSQWTTTPTAAELVAAARWEEHDG